MLNFIAIDCIQDIQYYASLMFGTVYRPTHSQKHAVSFPYMYLAIYFKRFHWNHTSGCHSWVSTTHNINNLRRINGLKSGSEHF